MSYLITATAESMSLSGGFDGLKKGKHLSGIMMRGLDFENCRVA